MASWQWLIFWWAAFGLSHMLLTGRRDFLISRLGPGGYMLLFSVIAFALFIPLVGSYINHAHEGPLLWVLPAWTRELGIGLSALGITGLVASIFQPSPTSMVAGSHLLSHGLTRVSRHPMFMSLGLWGIGHCLLNGFATDVVFFGGFAVFGIIGCAHQDYRKQKNFNENFGQLYAETSLLPFWAILTGRNRLVLKELPWFALILGLAIAVGLYLLHPWMFG